MEIPSILIVFPLKPPLLMTNTMGECLANLCGWKKAGGGKQWSGGMGIEAGSGDKIMKIVSCQSYVNQGHNHRPYLFPVHDRPQKVIFLEWVSEISRLNKSNQTNEYNQRISIVLELLIAKVCPGRKYVICEVFTARLQMSESAGYWIRSKNLFKLVRF